MRRDYSVYLEDMLQAIDRALAYTSGLSSADFQQDQMRVDAVVRNLEILGEAARRVPDDWRSRYPDVPWQEMSRLRNVLAHDYQSVDLDVIWDIIKSNLFQFAIP